MPDTPTDPPEPVPPALRAYAGGRLAGVVGRECARAGAALIENAPLVGIDLSLMWATLERDRTGRPAAVRQVCLAVPGAGRTAMLFVSGPGRHPNRQERAERAACVRAALEALSRDPAGRFVLAQSLPEPGEDWACLAYEDAGMTRVGELFYLRRRLGRVEGGDALPPGVSMEAIGALDGSARARLARVLEATYEGTLDCPELCGMRPVEDVIESHRSVGTWRPDLWWFVRCQGSDAGCVLTNATEGGGAELVYIGLVPAARGKGIGRAALRRAMRVLSGMGIESLTCAVDARNAPARAVYDSLRFRRIGSRIAYVRRIG